MIPPFLVLPHEHDAVLLGQVLEVDGPVTRAKATVRPGTPFGETGDGWPDWMMIELMAQAVAAGAGIREYEQGKVRPRLGLLLGVRNFVCSSASFPEGIDLGVEVKESSRTEHGMGVFDCTIYIDDLLVASAALSVYLPASLDEYLESLLP